MESINVIEDDHGKTPKRSVDNEDGLLWVPNSQKISTAGSKHSSLTKDNSPSHSNADSVTILVEITSVDNPEACESSVFDCQQTNEPSTKLPDTTNTTGSSVQKLVPPTHIAKNHPQAL